jgi:cytochrome c oxidase accessory protein FixG
VKAVTTLIDKTDVTAVNAGAKSKGLSLYALRQNIYPKAVSGDFRRLKWLVMLLTLGIYYVTPWLRWDRGPHAPDQAVLIDIAHRRFYFFFIEIWPQEFFYVAGLLVMAGVGLFLVTSVAGRAWCGYTCPQTVWTDLFLVVERFFDGDRNAQIKLGKEGWGLRKILLRLAKHSVWIVIAIATGGAWIFYFADAPALLTGFVMGDAPMVAYATVGVLTATTYVFGGLMREQVCIYMCPWPRVQAAMLDEDSLVVTYNDWRGEPRSAGTKKSAALGMEVGDCVDCNACVAVCPTGIDIRDGQQMECITCALCIDACNTVMDKLGKPRGLISYATLRDYNHNVGLATAGGSCAIKPNLVRQNGGFSAGVRHFDWRVFLRPRTLIYLLAWTGVGLAMFYFLVTRDRLEVNVLHDRNPVAVTLTDGAVRNGYTVKLLNMMPEARNLTLSIDGLPGATFAINELPSAGGTSAIVPVDPDVLRQLKVFVSQPKSDLKKGATAFRITVRDPASSEADTYETTFEVP